MVLALVQDWASSAAVPLMGGPRVGATSNPRPGIRAEGAPDSAAAAPAPSLAGAVAPRAPNSAGTRHASSSHSRGEQAVLCAKRARFRTFKAGSGHSKGYTFENPQRPTLLVTLSISRLSNTKCCDRESPFLFYFLFLGPVGTLPQLNHGRTSTLRTYCQNRLQGRTTCKYDLVLKKISSARSARSSRGRVSCLGQCAPVPCPSCKILLRASSHLCRACVLSPLFKFF